VENGKGQRLTLSVAKSYAREWESFGVDTTALEAIARSGQGKVLSGLEELRGVAPRTAPGHAEVAWVFLAAALALFVAQVAWHVARTRQTRL
jgi:hypothetical protein